VIGIAVLGSTGSIGESTLDVVARHADRFRVVALGAHRNVEKLLGQCRRLMPEVAAVADPQAARQLDSRLRFEGLPTRVLGGEEALAEIAALPAAHYVMAAIVGAAGLHSTLAAVRAGKRVLLANKESLVMGGALLLESARASGAEILPIDSEHNAIFQCLPPEAERGRAPRGVRRILLTASGGPFLDWPREALESVTPEQACAHPNWAMGRKISVDSATLMNKGLELIEASLLFGLPADRVQVLIHRQSIVHSLVEYLDGSILAQLGSPDMRTPIAHALAWPERIASGVEFLDLVKAGRLEFTSPDTVRFRCLALAEEAARGGGLAPVALNAANEVAVAAFLEGRLNFVGIAAVIEPVMARSWGGPTRDLEDVLAADREARAVAEALLARPGRLRGACA